MRRSGLSSCCRASLLKLGVNPTEAERDGRIAITLRTSGISRLRLNFGNWAILTFSGEAAAQDRVQFISRVDRVGPNAFADKIDGQAFALAYCSVASMRDSESFESREFAESLTIVARRFKDWEGSPFHAAHNPQLLSMVFDSKLRDEVLRAGLDAGGLERRFWWVNQGRGCTSRRRAADSFGPPKRTQSGATPFHWQNMTRVSPGDLVIHYADTQLRAISIVKSLAYDSDRGALPDDWDKDGWRSDLTYYELSRPVSITYIGSEDS